MWVVHAERCVGCGWGRRAAHAARLPPSTTNPPPRSAAGLPPCSSQGGGGAESVVALTPPVPPPPPLTHPPIHNNPPTPTPTPTHPALPRTFDDEPHTQLLKEMLAQTFATPRRHHRSKPFFDHVLSFSLVDGRVWLRNYQVGGVRWGGVGWAGGWGGWVGLVGGVGGWFASPATSPFYARCSRPPNVSPRKTPPLSPPPPPHTHTLSGAARPRQEEGVSSRRG